MEKNEAFGILNATIRKAIRKKEDPIAAQNKLKAYAKLIETDELLDKSGIEGFEAVTECIPELLSVYSKLFNTGVGIRIVPEEKEKEKIGFKQP